MNATVPAPWPSDARYLRNGDLVVDLCYRRIVGENEQELPQRIFDLLLLLLAEPNRLHTRTELFERLWPGVIVEDANLSQSVWLLRRALGEERKHWVRTVAKGGYVFAPAGQLEWFTELPPNTDKPEHAAKAAPGAASPPPMTVATETTDAGIAQVATPPPTSPRWRRWSVGAGIAVLIAVIAVAGTWLGGGAPKQAPPPHSPISVSLVVVEDPGSSAHWPAQLLYQWTNWKLGGLPEVTVLTEADLAAGAKSPAHTVFIAAREAADGSGDIQVDARLQQGGPELRLSAKGTAAQMPALVDRLSRQVVEQLVPRRAEPWPRLELDAGAARRYAEFAKAYERRDWMAASAIGEEVVRSAPRFALARLQLARAQSRLAQATSAVEHMQAARDLLRPAPAETVDLLQAQQLAIDPRRYQEAADAYARLVARYPAKAAYAIEYAGLLVRTGRPKQALPLLTSIDHASAPMGIRIARLLALADTYNALGDPARMHQHASAAERLARNAGDGWRLERGRALQQMALADSSQQGTGKQLYEQAAQQFEAAGNPTGALFARFLGEVKTASPAAGPNPRLDSLLAKAHAGGYRRLEIDILLQLAVQLHNAGDIPGYRRRLEQAAGVAHVAGDFRARNQLDAILAYEDLLGARLASARTRLQRLRQAGMEGDMGLSAARIESTLDEVTGHSRTALDVLERTRRMLPPPVPGQPLSKAQATLHCQHLGPRLSLGDLSGARRDLALCGEGTDASTRLRTMKWSAQTELLAGDHGAARQWLQRARALLRDADEGPDAWIDAIDMAYLLTRAGETGASDQLLRPLLPRLQSTGYALLAASGETGLAENAAARGDWAASRELVAAARNRVPPDAWAIVARLDLLDAAAALATGDHARGIAIASKVHEEALRFGDVVTQLQVRSLLPPGALPEQSVATHEVLVARTGMRGATLDWLQPAVALRSERGGEQ